MDNNKEDAESRMGLFLQILFSAINTTDIALCTTKEGNLVLQDQKYGYGKTLEPKEAKRLYKEYIIQNKLDDVNE